MYNLHLTSKEKSQRRRAIYYITIFSCGANKKKKIKKLDSTTRSLDLHFSQTARL